MNPAKLPGADLVEKGLRDLEDARCTDEALLVSIAAPRLRALGISVTSPLDEPEMALYHSLVRRFDDGAHARYNALIRRVVSFQRAAACAK